MVQIGYTLMGEQRGPKDLVADAILAEEAGFDFAVASDHFHPWVEAQGHSPYVWTVLGAVAQATQRLPLMTYVTTPIIRYHPAVIAQKAATLSILSDGRFTLGLGAGEKLNEHITGDAYPAVDVRHEMLIEALEIIQGLFDGGYFTFRGDYLEVEDAKLFDLPETPPRIGVAVSGPASCEIAGRYADLLIATEPKAELIELYQAEGGTGTDAVGQLPVCWGPDVDACTKLALELFGWSAGGWKLQAELPNPVNFEAYAKLVRAEDIADTIVLGNDPQKVVEGVEKFADAGFTHVALVQIGPDQKGFCDAFTGELGEALRAI